MSVQQRSSGLTARGSSSSPDRPIMNSNVHITAEQVDEYRQIFDLFEHTRSGFIDLKELYTALMAMGFEKLTKQEVSYRSYRLIKAPVFCTY